MSATAMEARPPYVIFEVREVEDRAATNETGAYTGRDVNFAIICPQGSKDRVERVAEDWFAHIENEVRSERFPREWLVAYRDAYKDWKEGRETPENGTPIKSWPPLSPSQVSQLLNLRIRTVEDLANLNEEGILRIGMGARGLQQKARDWLEQAAGTGKLVQSLDVLRQENESLKARNEELETKTSRMEARLVEIEKLLPQATGAKKL